MIESPVLSTRLAGGLLQHLEQPLARPLAADTPQCYASQAAFGARTPLCRCDQHGLDLVQRHDALENLGFHDAWHERRRLRSTPLEGGVVEHEDDDPGAQCQCQEGVAHQPSRSSPSGGA